MTDGDGLWAAPDEVSLLEGTAVPEPPAVLAPDERAVVAVWRQGDRGALMVIHYDPADDEEPYSVDVEHYQLLGDSWRYDGAGGSDWPSEYGMRPPAGQPLLTGFATGPMKDGLLWTGLAPVGIDHVRLKRPDGTMAEAQVEPRTGAFLVPLDYAGSYQVE